MEFHEVANIFPLMSEGELSELAEDVYEFGLVEPIWIYQGQIIDGRNRYLACQMAGIEPRFRNWSGQGSLVSFVVSLNLHRRHLTSGQRAAMAVDVLPLLEAEANDRRLATQNNDTGRAVKEMIPEQELGQSRDQAAKTFDTNGRYVSDAKRLKEDEPELFDQVKSGEISLPDAKRLEPLSENERQAVAETIASGEATSVAEATQQHGFNYKRDAKRSRAADEDKPKGYDDCQTPPYALPPISQYIDKSLAVWEPAKGEGYLEDALVEDGYTVISSSIQDGQNFFEYQPDSWGCLVTNPPFSLQFKWIERCYQLGKPWALLLPLETLGAKRAQAMFKAYGIEVVLLNRRVDFKMPNAGWDSSAQFPVAWFTWGFGIGERLVFAEIEKARPND